ncbi:MAG: DUF5689 domain-containing protein [Bacteroidota bacterium]
MLERITTYRLFVFFGIILSGCVQNTDFEPPELAGEKGTIEGTELTIPILRDLWLQEQNNNQYPVLSFSESNLFISGYVVSSDEAGNFFEELVIQNEPSDPSAGVRLLIDSNPLFTRYEFGRKIYVKLDGLTVGENNGVLTLGILDGGRVEKIAESLLTQFVVRDSVVAEITPLPVTREDFAPDKTNLFIQLDDVQFRADEVLGDDPKTFAGEPGDSFDGERRLVFCSNRRSTIFSTSTFADFKGLLLPEGRGKLDALLTYNFFGEEFNIVVNDPSDIQFDNQERCDPTTVDCGLAPSADGIIVFGDNFESQENNDPIEGNGWSNIIQEGTVLWEGFDGSSNNPPFGEISAQIGSFNSGDCSSIAWLITPQLDFDAISNPTLTFLTSTSFADESLLEVLVSTNWDGKSEDVDSFEWAILSSPRIANRGDNFQEYIPSGIIDLSCIQGTGHIAWRYTGSGASDFDGTYELDEIAIRSN